MSRLIVLGARCAAIALVALLLVGCAPKFYRLYEGPPKPAADVALVTTYTHWMAGDWLGTSVGDVKLLAVDGSPEDYGSTERAASVELLPGPHELLVTYCFSDEEDSSGWAEALTLNLIAEAGHSYMIRGVPPTIREIRTRSERVDRAEKILADETLFAPEFAERVRKVVMPRVASGRAGSFGLPVPPDRQPEIADIKSRYGSPDRVDEAPRGPSDPSLPEPPVDTRYTYGPLQLCVPKDSATSRVEFLRVMPVE